MSAVETYNILRGSVRTFDELLGRTVSHIEQSDHELILYLSRINYVRFYHHQECCEDVYIEDVCGDINDLVGSPLLVAEEVTDYTGPATEDESWTWTYYRFATQRGSVSVRWYGSSNGYYSESVDIEVVDCTK